VSPGAVTDERGVEHRWQLADRKVRLGLSAAGAKRHGRKTITLRQIVRRMSRLSLNLCLRRV